MIAQGANVFAVDLSSAVEANYANHVDRPGYFVAQADVLSLPVPDNTFDIVVCIGVIQHTPDPEATMSALCRYLKPGGLLLVDHYSLDYPVTPSRRRLRDFLLRRSPRFALNFCRYLVAVLWPLHRASYFIRSVPGLWHLRQWVLRTSPVVDYQDAYGALGPRLLYEWAVLDTHDTLTDRYKHLRSLDQIRDFLISCGMEKVEAAYGGNGIEARARKSSLRAHGPQPLSGAP